MREQLELLISVEQSTSLTATVGTRLSKHLDKALSMILKATTLQDVQKLSGTERQMLAKKMQVALTRNDLKAVSKKWEKDRTIEAEESHTQLCENLNSLLFGKRRPYSKLPASFSLKKALELPSAEKKALETKLRDWAPSAHVKSLAKKWDKHNPSIASASRNRQVDHLVGLLYARENPKPRPARK